MRKIIIGILMLSLIVLAGCDEYSVGSAYFTMGYGCEYEGQGWQEQCNSICKESGIRIANDRGISKVIYDEGMFICRCL